MKPENVLIGRRSQNKDNVLHVIDFGLAKPYIDSETKQHIAFAENRAITGTNSRETLDWILVVTFNSLKYLQHVEEC